MYDNSERWEAIQRVIVAAAELSDEISNLADALRKAMKPILNVFEELAELISEASETLAEEDTPQHHTMIFSCKLPGRIHADLIPWYPSGFQ